MPCSRRRINTLLAALAGAAVLFASSPVSADTVPAGDERPQIALAGTIPIYWGEAAGIGEIVEGEATPHWARARLERTARLRPVAWLGEEKLAPFDYLLLAQPRALSPEENVALDAWLRAGGHLLLFADPMMTGESRFGIGDRRRPQDVALLSPILSHWGLEMQFDEAQPLGLRRESGLPVNLPGGFLLRDEGEADCKLDPARIVARCAVGEGFAVIVADAALLDIAGPHEGAARALDGLLRDAFGEITGNGAANLPQAAENLGNPADLSGPNAPAGGADPP